MLCYGKARRYAQLIYLVKLKITVLKALKLHSLKNIENHTRESPLLPCERPFYGFIRVMTDILHMHA
jgi:hypothetical protein